MYLGEVSNKQLISVTLMIMFAFATMFFLGYRMAYGKAINYANEQIEEGIDTFKKSIGFMGVTEFTFEAIKTPSSFGGTPNEEEWKYNIFVTQRKKVLR